MGPNPQPFVEEIPPPAPETAPHLPWAPLLTPGTLTLIDGERGDRRAFHQELAHFAVHTRGGVVLWCDGDHGFNPYDFADLNLERGFDAEWGASRVLVKRCMTPFQWDTVLTKHVDQKLAATKASLVLIAPFDELFSTDELKDWEKEDYVEFALAHLRGVAARHRVSVVLSADMARWSCAFPRLGQMTWRASAARWHVERAGSGWSVVLAGAGARLGPPPVLQRTLIGFVPAAPTAGAGQPAPAPVPRAAPALRA